MSSNALLAVAVALTIPLGSCESPVDNSHWATGRFEGDKAIALNARYDAGSAALAVSVYADVPDGAPGVLELTGPEHWRCDGGIPPHPPARAAARADPELPRPGSGAGAHPT